MTKTPISTLIEEGAPLTPSDWNEEKERQRLERLEQVRQRCARENSESPLWRARVDTLISEAFNARHRLPDLRPSVSPRRPRI